MSRLLSPPIRVGLLIVMIAVGAGGLMACQSSHSDTAASSPARATASGQAALPDSVLTPPDSATARAFADAMTFAQAHDLHQQPVGRIMQVVGERYTGRPYRAGTLDEPPTERLVVRFDGFDCVTFIETLQAMAAAIQAQTYAYADFVRALVTLRYRNGTVGYCSRLHYFTDWMASNAHDGWVKRLDASLGGLALPDTIDFMSTHREAYARFASNDSLFACVRQMERSLRSAQRQQPVGYIPQDSIRATYDQLRAGDIVAFVTSIDGLDVAHTGLVYTHDDGSKGLLHASTSEGVVVLPDLQRYVQQIDHQIGIVVARPHVVNVHSAD